MSGEVNDMSVALFNIIQEMGILSEKKNGWRREINIVSWNGADPKYDIRDWAPNHEEAGKGIALKASEVKKLKEILINDFD